MKVVETKPPYVMTAEDILALDATEIPMLCGPLLQREGLASLCGSSDSGKSYLGLGVALAICSDEPQVLGLEITKQHGSAIIVCTEDAAEHISVRIKKLLAHETK